MKNSQIKNPAQTIRKKFFLPVRKVIFLLLCLAGIVCAESLTLPLEKRPEWLQRDGIVMAGSWEPLFFRVRRDGSEGYTPTAEQRAAYQREHSPEMVARLKAMGVNFIMMHCYKGAGMEMERESMADAVKFARLCHDAGLRVGVYNDSATLLWDSFFKEVPQAEDWVLLKKNGKPRTYGRATYRYYWNRNHPDAQAFCRQIIRFAVNDIGTDLLHFDNYIAGPGRDVNSVLRFRRYLRRTFSSERLRKMGIDDLDNVQPPMSGPPDNLLRRAWLDFSCQSLADSYHDMNRYARSLRKDILMECNPRGPRDYTRSHQDHGRLLTGGEAFWDEGRHTGYYDGELSTRIRTYKVARRMENAAFAYTTTPLAMAESMAFNRDCLGCICWFEYGRITNYPGRKGKAVVPETAPFVRFFHERRDLLRNAEVIADVAVLRSFPSQVFADLKYAGLTSQAEQALIDNHLCFQIIYNQHLDDLKRYRLLVLAGCVALSDRHIKQIEQYVESGGRVCIVGPVATHDEWMLPRKKPLLERLPSSRVVRITEKGDILNAVRQGCADELSLSVQTEAGPELGVELTEQAGRRLVHMVNYRSDKPGKKTPVKNIVIRLSLPAGRHARTVCLASPERKHDLELPFKEQDGLVTFTVPEVKIYEIAVVTMK
jgi:hypothetical protein